ncbi:hypothetical protein PR003_g516 [Phytophthora rubi]|uniref:Uncharacterized protein n=1 Tax=Phytophthora rubi TaxID=129364 RepID=A0A6A3NXV8_9STRA|nr:hypothetical protein PF003_g3754 [Phytophthora fragariae]KAE9045265.1 hypothetical protein PR002_g2323 [Phytophthora rubi]KAE9359900.1 hypothetical protein PR003_g516 [Phytophthora rubi]
MCGGVRSPSADANRTPSDAATGTYDSQTTDVTSATAQRPRAELRGDE